MTSRFLRIALVADGTSDRALFPILEWSIRELSRDARILLAGFHARGGRPLPAAIEEAVAVSRPDLLFVHRDAERVDLDVRLGEIPRDHSPLVRVVPVRMTEAWLLIDESAIRTAAGNPNGRGALEMPGLRKLESVTDAKAMLRDLLIAASGLTGPRRQKRLRRDLGVRVQRVAELIDDFSPLRELPAFRAFEEELGSALREGTRPESR